MIALVLLVLISVGLLHIHYPSIPYLEEVLLGDLYFMLCAVIIGLPVALK